MKLVFFFTFAFSFSFVHRRAECRLHSFKHFLFFIHSNENINKSFVVAVAVVIYKKAQSNLIQSLTAKNHLKCEIYLNILEIEYFAFRDRTNENTESGENQLENWANSKNRIQSIVCSMHSKFKCSYSHITLVVINLKRGWPNNVSRICEIKWIYWSR